MAGDARAAGQAARWAGQRERRREDFVEAALRVIATHGPAVSVEDIAAQVGVARTRLYRHFTDKADLERAISARVAQLVVADLEPLWHPQGSARQMISGAVGAYVGWLEANRNLYDYLRAHVDPLESDAEADSYPGVRRAVAEHLTALFGAYLDLFGVDTAVTADLAWAVLGMVESVACRPGQPLLVEPEVLVDRLTAWTWAMLAAVLTDVGIELDPDLPLPALPI